MSKEGQGEGAYQLFAHLEEIRDPLQAMRLMAERGTPAEISLLDSNKALAIYNSHISLPDINIWCATLNTPLKLRFQLPGDQLRLYFPNPVEARILTRSGAITRNASQAVACWTCDVIQAEFDAGDGGVAMTLSRARLNARLCDRLGASSAAAIRFDPEIPADQRGVAELSRFLQHLLQPDVQRILSGSIDASESMSRVIVDMVLDVFPSNYQKLWIGAKGEIYPAFLKRCINIIKSSDMIDLQNMSIDALVDVSRVSRRTLQYGFKKYIGLSPYAFLKLERLMRVREDILINRSKSIAAIADQHGYSNYARFTRAFFEQFGVHPSGIRRAAK